MPDFEVLLNDVGMWVDDRSKWFRNHHHPWQNLGQHSIERANPAVDLRTFLTQRYGFGSVQTLFDSSTLGHPPTRSSDSDGK
jgi:hypothetical protein